MNAPGKKREVSSFPGHIGRGEKCIENHWGISCLLEGWGLWTPGGPDKAGARTLNQYTWRRQHSSVQCWGLRLPVLGGVCVWGRSGTFAVGFFLGIIIIIIIIIIIFIILNTVSHLSTQKKNKTKLIHSLSRDANTGAWHALPSPLPNMYVHSFTHSFGHSWNQRVFVGTHSDRSGSVLIYDF